MSGPADSPGPRDTLELAGHDGPERALRRSFASGRMPHGWLIHGPRGIGKATLAFRFARFVLSGGDGQGDGLAVDEAHPVVRLVASGGHPDLRVVAPGFDEKRGRQRTEIVVDDVRDLGSFLRLTPAEGGWRVVIVDGAEAMNRNAANAILKSLEEPPRRAVLVLVSHAPGRLLPTIRSRCSALALKPLETETVVDLLGRRAPDLARDEALQLARMAEGSIGRALALMEGGGLDLWRQIVALVAGLPQMDAGDLHQLADRLGRRDADDAFRTACELIQGWLGRLVREVATGHSEPELVPGERQMLEQLAGRRSLEQWLGLWEKTGALLAQAQGLNLDRKQVLLTVFLDLEAFATHD